VVFSGPKEKEPRDASRKPKLPSEAIELYNRYIHGEIGRRDFLNGAKRFTVAGLTAGAILDALMPNYAAGQQVSKSDDRIKASYVTAGAPRHVMELVEGPTLE
jgi:carboxymethylenebutenolidase